MAKFVIAGPASCPYFAKIEVLAHTLSNVLPDFKFRTMLIMPSEWKGFVNEICQANDWEDVQRSPIIWREPLEFGGPKLFFGSFNEFQEYAFAYYDIGNSMPSSDMLALANTNLSNRVQETVTEFMPPTELIVTIVFAKSLTAYYFLPFLASGEIIQEDKRISLRLFDLTKEDEEALMNIAYEIENTSSPGIKHIAISTIIEEAVDEANIVIIFPGPNFDDIILDPILRTIGPSISAYAAEDLKVLLVYPCLRDVDVNLCNMRMALTMYLPPESILVVSGVTLQRAKCHLAERMNLHPSQISNFLIWGFNSSDPGCFHLDIDHATVKNSEQSAVFGPNVKSQVSSLIPDDQWLRRILPKMTAAHLNKTTQPSPNAMSLASVAARMLKYWYNGSGGNDIYSVGVVSTGWYGVDEGIFFNFPVTFDKPGKYTVLTDIDISASTSLAISQITKNYVKHMMEALIQRSEEITALVKKLDTEPKGDEPATQPIKLTESTRSIEEMRKPARTSSVNLRDSRITIS